MENFAFDSNFPTYSPAFDIHAHSQRSNLHMVRGRQGSPRPAGADRSRICPLAEGRCCSSSRRSGRRGCLRPRCGSPLNSGHAGRRIVTALWGTIYVVGVIVQLIKGNFPFPSLAFWSRWWTSQFSCPLAAADKTSQPTMPPERSRGPAGPLTSASSTLQWLLASSLSPPATSTTTSATSCWRTTTSRTTPSPSSSSE